MKCFQAALVQLRGSLRRIEAIHSALFFIICLVAKALSLGACIDLRQRGLCGDLVYLLRLGLRNSLHLAQYSVQM